LISVFQSSVVLLASLLLPAMAAEPIRFLPDDAQIACRAILPACFTRSGWAELCRANPELPLASSEACRQAFEQNEH